MTDNVAQAPKAIRPVRNFSVMIGNEFRKFYAGQRITDARTISLLLGMDCAAYIADADALVEHVACPKCHEVNRVDVASVPVRIVRSPVVLQIDRQTIALQPGQLLHHAFLIKTAEDAGYGGSLESGTALRCSKCAYVWA